MNSLKINILDIPINEKKSTHLKPIDKLLQSKEYSKFRINTLEPKSCQIASICSVTTMYIGSKLLSKNKIFLMHLGAFSFLFVYQTTIKAYTSDSHLVAKYKAHLESFEES